MNNFQALEPGQERSLVVWSDRCVGQNNNYEVITAFKYLVDREYFTNVCNILKAKFS